MTLRVVVWGTGNVGRPAIRAVAGHRDLELAGVVVSNPAKVGKDAEDVTLPNTIFLGTAMEYWANAPLNHDRTTTAGNDTLDSRNTDTLIAVWINPLDTSDVARDTVVIKPAFRAAEVGDQVAALLAVPFEHLFLPGDPQRVEPRGDGGGAGGGVGAGADRRDLGFPAHRDRVARRIGDGDRRKHEAGEQEQAGHARGAPGGQADRAQVAVGHVGSPGFDLSMPAACLPGTGGRHSLPARHTEGAA